MHWLNKSPTPNSIKSNRFSALGNIDCEQEKINGNHSSTLFKPPPIFVQNVEYISTLTKALSSLPFCKYSLKILSNKQVKIMTLEPAH